MPLVKGYVPDAEIGIEILKRRDRKFAETCELLKAGRFEEAVNLLAESGLSRDGILFFVATVLDTELPRIEGRVDAVLRHRTLIKLSRPVSARMKIREVVPAGIVKGGEERFVYSTSLSHSIVI